MKERSLVTEWRVLLAAIVVASAAATAVSRAETYTITTLGEDAVDNGNCTLREALLAAATDATHDLCLGDGASDTIVLDAVGVYALDDGEIVLSGRTLTVRGDGDEPRDAYVVDMGDVQRFLLAVSGADLTLENLVLTRGFGGVGASVGGGALGVSDSSLRLRDVEISSSRSIKGGGLHFASNVPATLDVERVEMTQNEASSLEASSQRSGGGMAVDLSSTVDVRLVSVRFAGNSIVANEANRVGYGGGLYLLQRGASSIELRHLTFDANVVETSTLANGFGLYADLGVGGAASMEDLEFIGNDYVGPATATSGSAFSVTVGGSTSASLRRVVARSNGPADSAVQGLVRARDTSSVLVSDLLVADGGGAGLYLDVQCLACSLVAGNLTVADNPGAGLTLGQNGAAIRVENSILFGNATVAGSDLVIAFGAPDVSSESLVGIDPQFSNQAAGDYRLGASSPAIDAGNQAFVSVGTLDAAHGARLSGDDIDLGAFEGGSIFSDDFEYGDLYAWSTPGSPTG